MKTTPDRHTRAETNAAPSPGGKLLDAVVNVDDVARSALNLAYDTHAILKRGVDEGSRRHVEAALVMLDYLAQEHLERLMRDVEQAAKTARAAQRWPQEV